MSKVVLIIGLVALFGIDAFADFSTELNENQEELYKSSLQSLSYGAKLFFGLFPFMMPILTMLFMRKSIIKNIKQEDDDRIKMYAIDAGLIIGSTLIGAFLLYMLGSFMFMKNGGGDTALVAFSQFWYELVVGD